MPTLIFNRDRFVLTCGYKERDIAKNQGMRWDRVDKIWYTRSYSVAGKLREFADERAREILNRRFITISPWSHPLPKTPKGLALLPHQATAIKFALERNHSYLGLDPGLGKTIVAAMIAKALDVRVFYICPPFMVLNTQEEFKKWAPRISLDVFPDSKIADPKVSDEIKYWARLAKKPVLFVDEAHRFKNAEAKRTKALFDIANCFDKHVFMSGSPMPNRPNELYTVLSEEAPETIDFMDHHEYGVKYCNAFHDGFGWDYSGASNMSELKLRVVAPHGPYMLRQRKKLLKLPPVTEEVFTVSHDMSTELKNIDAFIEKSHKDIDDIIKHRLASKHGRVVENLEMATYRRLLGLEMVKPASEFIKSILDETDDNILVFAYHKEVISKLKTTLSSYEPLVITGETPKDTRQGIVKLYQTSDRRVLIANYVAGGIGFNITKATRVVFVEFSWVDEENKQARDRAHRYGQENPVHVQFMCYKNSLSKKMIEVFLRKRKINKEFLGD